MSARRKAFGIAEAPTLNPTVQGQVDSGTFGATISYFRRSHPSDGTCGQTASPYILFIMDDRRELRQKLRQRRRSLSPKQQSDAAFNLCRRLRHQLFFLRAKHIALYLPNDGEIDPQPLLKLALRMGKHCYLPVLSPDDNNTLRFLPFDNRTVLTKNRFGIPEPQVRHHRQRKAKRLDLVLMPLVGFDAEGGRMGMGGGFYDRTFAFRQQQTNSKPRLVGLAHQCQQVAQLELASWDIPLDAIVTDQQLITPKS